MAPPDRHRGAPRRHLIVGRTGVRVAARVALDLFRYDEAHERRSLGYTALFPIGALPIGALPIGTVLAIAGALAIVPIRSVR